jgi:hypothetical protein
MKSGFESSPPIVGASSTSPQVICKPTAFVIHFYSAPGVRYSWRDGERPHVTAEGGELADVGVSTPRWSRGSDSTAGTQSDRCRGRGRPTSTTSTTSRGRSRCTTAPTVSTSRRMGRGNRTASSSALGDDDAVETAHHLCRPGVATEDLIGHATADRHVEVWTCDRGPSSRRRSDFAPSWAVGDGRSRSFQSTRGGRSDVFPGARLRSTRGERKRSARRGAAAKISGSA